MLLLGCWQEWRILSGYQFPSPHPHKISRGLRRVVGPKTLGHQTSRALPSSFLSSVHGHCLFVCSDVFI